MSNSADLTIDDKITLTGSIVELSGEANSLAREIDRLPAGNYMIVLLKPDLKGLPWRAEILYQERLRVLDLWR